MHETLSTLKHVYGTEPLKTTDFELKSSKNSKGTNAPPIFLQTWRTHGYRLISRACVYRVTSKRSVMNWVPLFIFISSYFRSRYRPNIVVIDSCAWCFMEDNTNINYQFPANTEFGRQRQVILFLCWTNKLFCFFHEFLSCIYLLIWMVI